MSRSARGEEGQAAPLYITAVVGLLFLALLYFVFGKADIRRNEAQTAADSAALAAAMESRDALKGDFLDHILDADYLNDLLKGDPVRTANGCDEARRFAARNNALTDDTFSCVKLVDGRWGFTVELQSQKTVGKSALPGTENKRAKAHATAIVEPLCGLKPNEDVEAPQGGGEGSGEGDKKPSPGTIQCDGGKKWIIDPEHQDLLPDLSDLFRVRLAEH
ncbi:pilus assembly protein TadG-related protein [Streptomyces colonosanans]|uniref:Putative Flp pilus-assembly TadG-like N-terminal domain-containing protein n=1 Tax=Streptomyces colonosanans TaxID=1428652 RepID=A0A1S2NW49_9ACTN|nr:pilus assembly protein TadG-related protein [Streptomyces colonosanans]OIJ85416.1 hypothetical protein BIV24_28510 [Streptomyces colonosanans]